MFEPKIGMILVRKMTLSQESTPSFFNEFCGSYIFLYDVQSEVVRAMVIDRGLNGTSRLGEDVDIPRRLLISYYFKVYMPGEAFFTACKHCKIASHVYHLTWPLEPAVAQVARIRDVARDLVMAHVMQGPENRILCETCLQQFGLDCLLHGHR